MKWGFGFLRQKIGIRSICKKIATRDKGVALILTLLILLTLVLLGLALLLQTDTEYLIAVNEQDSLETFHHAEAGLSWTKREVLDVATAAGFTDFSDLLNGLDNANAADDNLIPLKTLDLTLTVGTDQLTAANELATSIVVTKDFGDGSKTYEAFRLGINEDGDSDYDGPRALVYVRIDDNYDDASGNDPLVDTDQIVTATVVSEYPIFADEITGVATPGTRTIARRKLRARFGTAALQPAILSRRSLRVQGVARVCGECGSVHANESIYGGGDIEVCKNFTWHTPEPEPLVGDAQFNCPDEEPGPDIEEECGSGFDIIEVPVINPYDDVMVPIPSQFAGSESFGNPTACDASTPKYYALVPILVGGQKRGFVYKAYWDNAARPNPKSGNPAGGWKWRLIDDLSDGNNTMLDDCGRVICGTVGGTSVHDIGDGVCNSSGEYWLDDDKNEEFYGFKLNDEWTTNITNCTGDATLDEAGEIADNDFNRPDFYRYSDNTAATDPDGIAVPMIPGGFDKDGIRDFEDSTVEEGKARWIRSASDLLHSPIYNAVVFIYGRLEISENPGTAGTAICTGTSSGLANKKCEKSGSPLLSTYGGIWRVSFIAVESIAVTGNPKYSPAMPEFPFLLVAGRDIMVSGSPAGETICDADDEDVCAVNVGNSAEYAGIIAAHEQIKMNGDFSLDGFIIIEDAVDCTDDVAEREGGTGEPLDWSGNQNIHYDCVHPPNPWASKVKLTSWEEVQ